MDDRITAFVRGGDIKEAELIRAGFVVNLCLFDRIASIDDIDEVHAFDDAAVIDIQAGNDAGF